MPVFKKSNGQSNIQSQYTKLEVTKNEEKMMKPTIYWESEIKKKILKHFQKRTNDPYFPRLIKTFKDLGRKQCVEN